MRNPAHRPPYETGHVYTSTKHDQDNQALYDAGFRLIPEGKYYGPFWGSLFRWEKHDETSIL